jgi:hypothetical protein
MNRISIGLKREVTLRGRNTIMHYVTELLKPGIKLPLMFIYIYIIRGQSLSL